MHETLTKIDPAATPATPGRRRILPTMAERNMLATLANDTAGCGVQGTRTTAETFAKLLVGWEHGLPSGTALNDIKLIDGRLTLPEMVAVAAIRASGIGDIRTVEVAADHATVAVTRADWPAGREERVTYTLQDAIQAGLVTLDANGRNTSRKDNWRKAAPSMLLARARGEAKRRYFEEEAAGLAYSPDELGADTDEDGRLIEEPVTLAPAAPPPGIKLAEPTPAPADAPAAPAADLAQPAGEPTPPPTPPGIRIAASGPTACGATAAPVSAAPTDAAQHPTVAPPPADPLVAQAGALVKALAIKKDDWQQIVARISGNGATSIRDLDGQAKARVVDFLTTLQRIEQLRALAGISDASWEAALKRKGVTRTIDMDPADAEAACQKLGELVTPFDRARLGIPDATATGNNLAGKA